MFVVLTDVIVWSISDLIKITQDSSYSLKNFLNYRVRYLVKQYPHHDTATLLTSDLFAGGLTSSSLRKVICTNEYSGGIVVAHSEDLKVVATTVAHDLGHRLGMNHDESDCVCADKECIMSPSVSEEPKSSWSSCSIDQMNLAFHHGMDYCLKNTPSNVFGGPVCGNGLLEDGEECDCGLPKSCNSSCCNPHTCMFHGDATCATGPCCNLATCKLHSPGKSCRESSGECDLPEYCNGDDEFCPVDMFKQNGLKCNREQSFCYQGSCRSHLDQCKMLWGPTGFSTEQCYDKNVNGSRHGNCGYDDIEKIYQPCLQEDVKCGRLHCRHLNERLEFGMEASAILSHSFIQYHRYVVPCRTAFVDLGFQSTDPGLVPNGAKCGDDMMCVDQKCFTIKGLKASGKIRDCQDCHGHGICNSEGNCHCNDGYSPPLCNEPGYGGSIDSGPVVV